MPRGRPRDPSRDRAILTAARATIAADGYTGATMEDIAKRARVGKDTLYRRWSSKERLALDLVDTMARDAVRPSPIDPDPRINLFLFIKDVVRLYRNTDFGGLVAGLVGEAARNAGLAEGFAEFWHRRRAIAASLVRDVVGADATDELVAVNLDRLLGPIYYHLLLTQADLPDDYLWDLVVAIPWDDDESRDAWNDQETETEGAGELAGVSNRK